MRFILFSSLALQSRDKILLQIFYTIQISNIYYYFENHPRSQPPLLDIINPLQVISNQLHTLVCKSCHQRHYISTTYFSMQKLPPKTLMYWNGLQNGDKAPLNSMGPGGGDCKRHLYYLLRFVVKQVILSRVL
jgi:hypothetical protein